MEFGERFVPYHYHHYHHRHRLRFARLHCCSSIVALYPVTSVIARCCIVGLGFYFSFLTRAWVTAWKLLHGQCAKTGTNSISKHTANDSPLCVVYRISWGSGRWGFCGLFSLLFCFFLPSWIFSNIFLLIIMKVHRYYWVAFALFRLFCFYLSPLLDWFFLGKLWSEKQVFCMELERASGPHSTGTSSHGAIMGGWITCLLVFAPLFLSCFASARRCNMGRFSNLFLAWSFLHTTHSYSYPLTTDTHTCTTWNMALFVSIFFKHPE